MIRFWFLSIGTHLLNILSINPCSFYCPARLQLFENSGFANVQKQPGPDGFYIKASLHHLSTGEKLKTSVQHKLKCRNSISRTRPAKEQDNHVEQAEKCIACLMNIKIVTNGELDMMKKLHKRSRCRHRCRRRHHCWIAAIRRQKWIVNSFTLRPICSDYGDTHQRTLPHETLEYYCNFDSLSSERNWRRAARAHRSFCAASCELRPGSAARPNPGRFLYPRTPGASIIFSTLSHRYCFCSFTFFYLLAHFLGISLFFFVLLWIALFSITKKICAALIHFILASEEETTQDKDVLSTWHHCQRWPIRTFSIVV